jgi:uncharacterized protein YhhL (DUF1145 family)
MCLATAGDVVNVILAILIRVRSLSLVLLGPEMQSMSLIIYYERLNIICLVLGLSHMLREGEKKKKRKRSENDGDDSEESEGN